MCVPRVLRAADGCLGEVHPHDLGREEGCDAFHTECFWQYCAKNPFIRSSAPMCYPCTIIRELEVDAEEDEALFVDDHVDGRGAALMCKARGAKAANSDMQKLPHRRRSAQIARERALVLPIQRGRLLSTLRC